jgi:hypothetical protein
MWYLATSGDNSVGFFLVSGNLHIIRFYRRVALYRVAVYPVVDQIEAKRFCNTFLQGLNGKF